MNLQKIIEKQEELIIFLDDCNFETMISKEAWDKRKELFNDLASLKAQEESKSAEGISDICGRCVFKANYDKFHNAKVAFNAQSHEVEMLGDVAKTETDTGKLIDMPDITCDVCGRHPAVIVQTQFGRYCMEHAKYV